MSQTPVDFLNMFVRPPGDLLYFLAVIAISQASLFMALGQRLRRPQDRAAQRYTLAALGTVIAWVVLMGGALFALLSNQSSDVILPPLERTASMVTILLLGWAFLTADHNRWQRSSNVILLILMAGAVVGYVITATQWLDLATHLDFNQSVFGLTWTFASAILSVLGILLTVVYFRVIVDAPLKLVFFVILLLGYGGTLYQITQGNLIGDYAGPSRLVFLAVLPILPVAIYRMIIGRLSIASVPQTMPSLGQVKSAVRDTSDSAPPKPLSGTVTSPIERESVQLLRALGLILEKSTPTNIPEQIVMAAIEVLKADVGALLKLQDANYADVLAAYDKVMERSVSGMALNLDNQPTLVNAIERQANRPLYPDRNVEELQDFYTRLDINQVGPVYFQPLVHKGSLVAVLALALPYSRRELYDAEVELLKGIGVISGSLLALSFAANEARLMAEERAIQAMVQGLAPDDLEDDQVIAARQEMQASLELARDQIAQLSHQVMELKIQLDDERSRIASALGDTEQGLSVSQRILVLSEDQQRLREERDRLASRLKEAEAMLAGATATDDRAVVQRLIEGLQREKEDLLTQRESLQAQLDEVRANDQILLPQEVQLLVERMSQERAQLELERDQLNDKLTDIQHELKAFGIEDGISGLTQLLGQLYEQRATLQNRNEALKRERDTLLSERTRLEDSIKREKERETRIQTLQTELLQLAADREVMTKQRDKLRAERDELLAKQDAIKQHRARLLAQASGYELELTEAHQEMIQLRTRLQGLAEERSSLISERDQLRADNKSIETERDQLLARIDGDRDRLQQLGEDGVGSLTKMIEELSEQRNQLERELNQTKTKLAALEDQYEALQVKATDELKSAAKSLQLENPELIMGLVQELRTPMTSISGYVDLLLGESAGILGEMQRKFLQRVSANVTRLASMLDDLRQVTALDTGQFVLTHEPIDVVALIEDAITNASSQFREKGLTVHLNLDDNLPMLRADRDAVSQIIGQLLTNAYLVSPPDSEIFIVARRQQIALSHNSSKDKLKESLFVSVEDRGGGIAAEDEARVFARKYKAENPLIQGLGDTGVGLSVAKALVEAHGGMLWLESHENVGSVFSFALPLDPALEPES